MPFEMPCPGCSAPIRVSENMIGFRIRCLQCQAVLEIVPGQGGAQVILSPVAEETPLPAVAAAKEGDPVLPLKLWSEGKQVLPEDLSALRVLLQEGNPEKIAAAFTTALRSGKIRAARFLAKSLPSELGKDRFVQELLELKKILRRLRRIRRRIKLRLKGKDNQGLEPLLEEYIQMDPERQDIRRLLVLLQKERLGRRMMHAGTALREGRAAVAADLLEEALRRDWIIPIPEAEMRALLQEAKKNQAESEAQQKAGAILAEAALLVPKKRFYRILKMLRDPVFQQELPTRTLDRLESLRLIARARFTQRLFFGLTIGLATLCVLLMGTWLFVEWVKE